MIEIINPRHTEELIDYRIEFTDKDGNGCSFPCDENGTLYRSLPMLLKRTTTTA